MTTSIKPAPKPKNWLLAKSRQWHTWGGLLAALFLLVVGSTGIVLNYKKPILTALGLEKIPPAREAKPSAPPTSGGENPPTISAKMTTATGLNAAAFGVERALELARQEWGDVPLERIEMKDEHGELLCKVKRSSGQELVVNATTGAHFVKGEYEKVANAKAGEPPVRQFDWGKVMLDLHTGKIGGEAGKAFMSVVSLVLLFLSASGVYMWAKPVFIRRQNAKARGAASAAPRTAPAASPAPVAARDAVEV